MCIRDRLYIWKQLGFEQERDELHLSGDLNDKELLLPELRKFIRQVFIMNPATNLDLQAITKMCIGDRSKAVAVASPTLQLPAARMLTD